jgi:hypothetical protein
MTVLMSLSVLKGDGDPPVINGDAAGRVAGCRHVRTCSSQIDSTISYFHIIARSGPISESPVRRRASMSSMEDIHPEPDASPKPAKGTLGRLSHTFNNLRESFSSSHDLEHTVWTARSDYAYDTRLLFKRRIRNLYIAFTNLRSFVEVNYSGFRKIIKKYVFNIYFFRVLYRLYDICRCHIVALALTTASFERHAK